MRQRARVSVFFSHTTIIAAHVFADFHLRLVLFVRTWVALRMGAMVAAGICHVTDRRAVSPESICSDVKLSKARAIGSQSNAYEHFYQHICENMCRRPPALET